MALTPMQEVMKWRSEGLRDGTTKRDPIEDTADDLWQSLCQYADQYLALLADYEALLDAS